MKGITQTIADMSEQVRVMLEHFEQIDEVPSQQPSFDICDTQETVYVVQEPV